MKPVYENSFPQATINFQYKNEEELVRDFVAGRAKVIIISRELSPAENQEAAVNQKIEIREHIFAYDAVAVIAGKNYKDSVLAIEKIPEFLLLHTSTKLIFDNAYSGIAKQVMQLCQVNPSAFKYAFVVKNPQEVIDYVSNDPHAVGFIPFNYISNSYEQSDLNNRQKIKLLGLSQKDTVYKLSQENIAYSYYPLKRPLNIILGNSPDLVGIGFTNFLHRTQAAKILLKSGLVPKFLPVRKVVVREELNAQ
jgi:phosphate transport system substrate-binding protein